METEYIVISYTTKEALWLRSLLFQLRIQHNTATEIKYDNQAAIVSANDEEMHSRSKHIDVGHHFIKDYIQQKHTSLNYVSTKDNIADLLIKALPIPIYNQLIELLGMRKA